jgi:hypothetical protein
VVLAIEALIATGTKPGRAASIVADRFPNLRAFAGPRASASPLAIVLGNWRKEFISGRINDYEAGSVFEEGVKGIKTLIAAGRRNEGLALADNVDLAAELGGVLSPDRPTKNSV